MVPGIVSVSYYSCISHMAICPGIIFLCEITQAYKCLTGSTEDGFEMEGCAFLIQRYLFKWLWNCFWEIVAMDPRELAPWPPTISKVWIFFQGNPCTRGGVLQYCSDRPILKTLQFLAGSTTIALCTSGLSGGVRYSKADNTQWWFLSRAACFLCVTAWLRKQSLSLML